MHKTTNTIAELPNGWLNRHTGRHYASAAQAYAAVLRADRKVKVGAITTINWVPSTAAGTAAVKALSEGRKSLSGEKLSGDKYWLSPAGKFIEVEDHEPSAADILGKEYDPDDSWMDRHTATLVRKGWIRVAEVDDDAGAMSVAGITDDDRGAILISQAQGPLKMTKAQRAALEDQAFLGFDIIYDGTGRPQTVFNAVRREIEEAAEEGDEDIFDEREGMGSTPLNIDAAYFGFKRRMKPSEFLALAAPRPSYPSAKWIVQQLLAGKKMATPFLGVAWDADKKIWQAVSHEGRNRMHVLQMRGDKPVNVYIFPRGLRARHMTPEMLSAEIKPEREGRS